MTFGLPLGLLFLISLSVLVLNSHANEVEKPYLESKETWRRRDLVWYRVFCSKSYAYSNAGSTSSRYEYLCQATIREKRVGETVLNDTDVNRYLRPSKSDANTTTVRDTVIPVDSPAGITNIKQQSYSVDRISRSVHGEKRDEEITPPDNHRTSDRSYIAVPVILSITPVSTVVAIALCILCKRKTLRQGIPSMTAHQPNHSFGTPTSSQGEIVPPVYSSQPIGHFSISGHQVVGERYLWCGRINIPFVTDVYSVDSESVHGIPQFLYPPNCPPGMEEQVHSYEMQSQQDVDEYSTCRPAPGIFTDSESTSTAHSSIESLRT